MKDAIKDALKVQDMDKMKENILKLRIMALETDPSKRKQLVRLFV